MTLSSGINPADLEPSIRPQDDLFAHVNARWIAATPIPPDRSGYGSFYILDESAEVAVREILEAAAEAPDTPEAAAVGDLYASFLDEAACEARAEGPVAERLASIGAATRLEELVRLLAAREREGAPGFFGVMVDADPGDPTRSLVHLAQGGISLPDESYYRDEDFAEVRDAFVAHVGRLLGLGGLSEPEARAKRVLELETALAGGHWDAVRARDETATYNLRTASSLRDAHPLLAAWAEELGAPLDEFVLMMPSYAEALAGLLEESRLEQWRDWSAYRVLAAEAPYLSRDFVEESFDFYGRTLTGQPELRARWKRAVGLVDALMGEAVGRLYVEEHFRPSAKTRMDELVGHLIEAYRSSISSLGWMSPTTRERALAKLDAFTPKIGYPDRWRDYSGLRVSREDLVGNVRAGGAFEFARQMAKVAQPVDRAEWLCTPQTVNAFYNPRVNDITFPAEILQAPFFDETRDDAANYGAIGAIIGHEIGHGFDDQGSKYDGQGRLVDWWQDADRAAFEERTAALIAQYDAIVPRGLDVHVNGALTVGENIGDLGGLGIAWRAYQISLAGTEAALIDGLSGPQRFFLAWAQAWRVVRRPELARQLIAMDPHSPDEARCNQVSRNLDAFHEAFAVGPDDAMWLDPSQRVAIW